MVAIIGSLPTMQVIRVTREKHGEKNGEKEESLFDTVVPLLKTGVKTLAFEF